MSKKSKKHKVVEGEGPDGIIILHFPKDGTDAYGVGPYPPIPALVDWILEHSKCDCGRRPLPVVFPKGVSMAFAIPDEVIAMAEAMVNADGPVH